MKQKNNFIEKKQTKEKNLHVKNQSQYEKKYRQIEQIGKGKSSVCFLVKNIQENKFYTSKKITQSKFNEKQKKQCELELQLLKKFKHPHIVSFKESFLEDDVIIIIMEYCEEGDLLFHIKQKEKEKQLFSEQIVLNWFIQITLALDYIHDQNILHRDIKCSNIFLTRAGCVKLGDFGISHILQPEQEDVNSSTLIEVSPYISPEICLNKSYTYQSDIWSLGCVLYMICQLKMPFQSVNLISLSNRIVNDACPSLQKHYSSDINFLVQLLLAKNQFDRPLTKQIFKFPFIMKAMEDFISQKGIKGEFQNFKIKKTKLHIQREQNIIKKQPKMQQVQMKQYNADCLFQDNQKEITKNDFNHRQSKQLLKQKPSIIQKNKQIKEKNIKLNQQEQRKVQNFIVNNTKNISVQPQQAKIFPQNQQINNKINNLKNQTKKSEQSNQNDEQEEKSQQNTQKNTNQEQSSQNTTQQEQSNPFIDDYSEEISFNISLTHNSAFLLSKLKFLQETNNLKQKEPEQDNQNEALPEEQTYTQTNYNNSFDNLPQREDYSMSEDEDDFDISSEENDQNEAKDPFRLTNKNLNQEIDEVISIYKSQLMASCDFEAINKYKNMVSLTEIQEITGELSTG